MGEEEKVERARAHTHARAAGAKIGAHRETRARRRAIILSSAKGNGKGTKMDGPGLRKTVLVLVRVGLFMGGWTPQTPPASGGRPEVSISAARSTARGSPELVQIAG